MVSTPRHARAEARIGKELALLGDLAPAELRSTWEALTGTEVPRIAAALLRRLLAQRLQEKRLGGLPALVVRELVRSRTPVALPIVTKPSRKLAPGARLIREWQGRTIAVLTTETGYSWEGRHYRSLSKIAHEVTGAHWSGPRFFGLTRRG
ncbi:DUF2924 domain-containing protein [Parablastomonas sp. CN1-191]|uniref:DUF2924 domain-containing protein n=1 Tax=Parablastomonas sp. CN1-191 TaxID=3400908 RepID=UPI003BF8CE44